MAACRTAKRRVARTITLLVGLAFQWRRLESSFFVTKACLSLQQHIVCLIWELHKAFRGSCNRIFVDGCTLNFRCQNVLSGLHARWGQWSINFEFTDVLTPVEVTTCSCICVSAANTRVHVVFIDFVDVLLLEQVTWRCRLSSLVKRYRLLIVRSRVALSESFLRPSIDRQVHDLRIWVVGCTQLFHSEVLVFEVRKAGDLSLLTTTQHFFIRHLLCLSFDWDLDAVEGLVAKLWSDSLVSFECWHELLLWL